MSPFKRREDSSMSSFKRREDSSMSPFLGREDSSMSSFRKRKEREEMFYKDYLKVCVDNDEDYLMGKIFAKRHPKILISKQEYADTKYMLHHIRGQFKRLEGKPDFKHDLLRVLKYMFLFLLCYLVFFNLYEARKGDGQMFFGSRWFINWNRLKKEKAKAEVQKHMWDDFTFTHNTDAAEQLRQDERAKKIEQLKDMERKKHIIIQEEKREAERKNLARDWRDR